MSENIPVYSIQQTYIIKPVSKSEKRILTCDERIDIPTFEELMGKKTVVYSDEFSKIIPCIELAGKILDEFKLEFETNEGITVLPLKIYPSSANPLDNPYMSFRYVLVLPRGATGVKSCKLIHKATGKEVQHNFTFGIMPPPYNYDNALFGYISYRAKENESAIRDMHKQLEDLTARVNSLKLTTKSPTFTSIDLPKGAGKQTINVKNDVLFYQTSFSYPYSSQSTIHKPKITLRGLGRDFVYTLSLNRDNNDVSIDLFTGVITVYDLDTGEILQQFKLLKHLIGFETLSFENFDDIRNNVLHVNVMGACVK